jgi:rubredoxin
MELDFVCPECKALLDADDVPYQWTESLESITLPRVVKIFCPDCEADREFLLSWDVILDGVEFFGAAERARLDKYLAIAAGDDDDITDDELRAAINSL